MHLNIDPVNLKLIEIDHQRANKNKVILPYFNKKTLENFLKKNRDFISDINLNDDLYKLNNVNKKFHRVYIKKNEEIIQAKIRLDGLGVEHFDGSLTDSTFKINLKKNNYLNNMNEFRIMSSKALNGYESMYFKLLKSFDYPIVNYSIQNINFNFDEQKTRNVILEESINKSFLEKNILREGSIYKNDIYDIFSLLLLREKRLNLYARGKTDFTISFTDYENQYLNSNFNLKPIYESKNRKNENKFARELLIKFVNNENSPNETFDILNLSRLYAINTIWGQTHSLQMHNIRYYFNPIIKKFYLISTDPMPPYALNDSNLSELQNYIFNYDHEDKIPFFSNLPFPIYSDHNTKILKSKEFQYFYIKNLLLMVNDLEHKQKYYDLNNQIIKDNLYNIKRIFLDFEKENNFLENKIIPNINNSNFTKVFNIDHQNKKITFKESNINLKSKLEIPLILRDYTLYLQKDLKINFLKNSELILHSNVKSYTYDSDTFVVFNSKSKNSSIKFFGKENILENVKFKNFDLTKRDNENFLTSPITFYNTNLILKNVYIDNTNSEDLLNIVNSKFYISKSKFTKSSSDLVDIDNSEGKIVDSIFKNCANDCLDFSGSTVELKNLMIDNAGDKSISIGENSNILGSNINVNESSNVCIAVKDSSSVYLSNLNIKNCEYGLAAFVKKKEFNKPFIEIENLKYSKIKFPIISEVHGSIKLINSKIIIELDKNIYNKIYLNE